MNNKIASSVLSVFLALAVCFTCSCGGNEKKEQAEKNQTESDQEKSSQAADAEEIPAAPFCQESWDLSGIVADVDLGQTDINFEDSVLYNQSLEEVLFDEAYDYFGLDKNKPEDRELLRYMVGNANYRLVLGRLLKQEGSFWGDLKEDLNLFVYDLEGYSVGDLLSVTDTSGIETVFRQQGEQAGKQAVLELFRGFMNDGQINVVAGFNPDRSRDPWWLQLLINVFSSGTFQASGGTFQINVVANTDNSAVERLTLPYGQTISLVAGELDLDFPNGSLVGTYCLKTLVSGN